MPKGSSRKGIGGWKRGARPGNYTDMQLNIACRISNGFDTSSGCSFIKQAAISLGYIEGGDCHTGVSRPNGSVCHGVGADAPAGAYGKAH